jgi:hypothetical protein
MITPPLSYGARADLQQLEAETHDDATWTRKVARSHLGERDKEAFDSG